MRKVAMETFQEKQDKSFIWKKDSRVAVLLEHSGHWWGILETLFQELAIDCEVRYYEVIADESVWDKQRQEIYQWEPEGLVGLGGFDVLQRVCWLHNTMVNESHRMWLVSGRDRWHLLEKDILWIRNRNGETVYWGYQRKSEQDLLILPDEIMNESDFKTEWRKWELLRRANAIWQKGLNELLVEKSTDEEESGRTLLEELAEPMRILYGIPMEIGIYYGIMYLYRQLSMEQKKELCNHCGVELKQGIWCFEKQVLESCENELSCVCLSQRDIYHLTQMAMEGIENLPPNQQLSWQQVEDFYYELS